jgi:hypothetical protein
MAPPICTHDDSNDVVCCKKVPIGGGVSTKLHFGLKNPKFWDQNTQRTFDQ